MRRRMRLCVVNRVALPEVIDRRIQVVGEAVEGMLVGREVPVETSRRRRIAIRSRKAPRKSLERIGRNHGLLCVQVDELGVNKEEQLVVEQSPAQTSANIFSRIIRILIPRRRGKPQGAVAEEAI